jgi:hypothetical protein
MLYIGLILIIHVHWLGSSQWALPTIAVLLSFNIGGMQFLCNRLNGDELDAGVTVRLMSRLVKALLNFGILIVKDILVCFDSLLGIVIFLITIWNVDDLAEVLIHLDLPFFFASPFQ